MAWWHSALHRNLIVDSCFSRYRVAKVQWLQDVIPAPGSPEQKEVCALCLLFNFLLDSFTCFACIWTTSWMCICSFFTRVTCALQGHLQHQFSHVCSYVHCLRNFHLQLFHWSLCQLFVPSRVIYSVSFTVIRIHCVSGLLFQHGHLE
jgi:hypothetical protein